MEYTILKNRIGNNVIKYQFAKPDRSKLTYSEFIQLLKVKDRNFLREFDRQLSQTQQNFRFNQLLIFENVFQYQAKQLIESLSLW
jgi:hypothetical protein